MRPVVVKTAGLIAASMIGLGAIPSSGPSAVSTASPSAVRIPAQVTTSTHLPPVDAPISDPFRAPEHDFGPGNRGIEYGTEVGQPVSASAPGTVSFAGSVAGNRFVTVDHGGGLVTTVGFLESIAVSNGEVVGQGQTLGVSGSKTHFSARQDGTYFDPALLFSSFVTFVQLVPTPR